MDAFFEEVSHTDDTKVHSLWVEKYRPTTIENYIGNENIINTIKSYIDQQNIPHLMLYGGAGTGKTTLAKLLTKQINCDVLYINASDENKVDNVRTKIKSFASCVGIKPLKVIILDECDYMSPEAQAALRNLMETFSMSTRFILTCNYHEKMILPIVSRCMTFEITPMTKVSVAVHVTKILKTENVEYQNDDLAYIVNTYYPDIRKVINVAQQSTFEGKLKINKESSLKTDTHQKLIEMIKNGIGKPTTFNEIRQFLADQRIKVYDDYFAVLYQKVDEYSNGKQAIATIIISEYMYQCSLLITPLKEIALMACISKLLNDLRK